MRAYVTGGDGFVGTFLQELLRHNGDEIVAPFIDLADKDKLRQSFVDARPDVIYHLAGQASVDRSWGDSSETFAVNAVGTLHVVEAAASLEHKPRVIIVSSGEVYGSVAPDECPVGEDRIPAPLNPYGASKAAAEVVALQTWRARDLPVIVSRPFNHIGPGQSPGFLVSDVAKRIAEAERDGNDTIAIGSLSAIRDFSNVRDIVSAYRTLAVEGMPGRIYNVGSGIGTPVLSVVEKLLSLAKHPMRLTTDPARPARPREIPKLVADVTRIRHDTSWVPRHGIDDALAETLQWWRERVRKDLPES
jgi:GDP-4-dehydro-6-deoxy-D-mannose reductase